MKFAMQQKFPAAIFRAGLWQTDRMTRPNFIIKGAYRRHDSTKKDVYHENNLVKYEKHAQPQQSNTYICEIKKIRMFTKHPYFLLSREWDSLFQMDIFLTQCLVHL